MSFSSFANEGYQVLENFWTDGDTTEMARLVRLIQANRVGEYKHSEEFMRETSQTVKHFVDPHLQISSFNRFLKSRDLESIACAALETRCEFWTALVLWSMPGEQQGQSWHQDLDPRFGQGSALNMLSYPYGMSVASGRVRVVPGSHQGQMLTEGDAYGTIPGEIELVVGPQDLLLLDCCCFHMVPCAERGSERIALNVRYRRKDAPSKSFDVGVYRAGRYDFKNARFEE